MKVRSKDSFNLRLRYGTSLDGRAIFKDSDIVSANGILNHEFVTMSSIIKSIMRILDQIIY